MLFSDDGYPGNMMDGYRDHGMNNGGVWMMVVFGLLLLALAGTAVFFAMRAGGSAAPGGRSASRESSRDVLDLRLARGEINPEEYSAARALLDP